MSDKTKVRGHITYDSEYGHVCTCSETLHPYYESGLRTNYFQSAYDNTVRVARDVEPTESGSYWYVCERCGAGGWSGL